MWNLYRATYCYQPDLIFINTFISKRARKLWLGYKFLSKLGLPYFREKANSNEIHYLGGGGGVFHEPGSRYYWDDHLNSYWISRIKEEQRTWMRIHYSVVESEDNVASSWQRSLKVTAVSFKLEPLYPISSGSLPLSYEDS